MIDIGLSCTSTAAGGKPIRKIPKRNIQQLVAQPSTTSTSTIVFFLTETEINFFLPLIIGTESSRSIDQVYPCHQIVSLIENKAKKLCKNQAVDMIAYEIRFLFHLFSLFFDFPVIPKHSLFDVIQVDFVLIHPILIHYIFGHTVFSMYSHIFAIDDLSIVCFFFFRLAATNYQTLGSIFFEK
jgi:hypothetical protein